VIREATAADEPALRALDRRIWSWLHAPVEPRDQPFDTEGVLVHEADGEIAGYVAWRGADASGTAAAGDRRSACRARLPWCGRGRLVYAIAALE
jgi:hypothetical protein